MAAGAKGTPKAGKSTRGRPKSTRGRPKGTQRAGDSSGVLRGKAGSSGPALVACSVLPSLPFPSLRPYLGGCPNLRVLCQVRGRCQAVMGGEELSASILHPNILLLQRSCIGFPPVAASLKEKASSRRCCQAPGTAPAATRGLQEEK